MASDTSKVNTPEMSVWRQRLWPVYAHELKKFIPMVIMMFWILFNYTIVRNIKDTLLINAPHANSEVLAWVKICFVTPASILFVIFYAKLSNALSKERLFYTTLFPFAVFFFLFAFFIYPLHSILHVSPETLAGWQKSLPFFAKGLPAVAYWTFSLFYIMAELWGNVGVALLFWQFANQITPTSEAKRFYPIFGFWSNLGLVCAGLLLKYGEPILESWDRSRGIAAVVGERDFTAQVQLLCSFVVLGCLVVGATYWWMNKYVLKDPQYAESNVGGGKKKSKPKMSIGESLKFLLGSRYLGYITILVLAYGITINIVELSWKESVKSFYGSDKNAYSAFMGNLYIWTGITTMILIMFSQNILRNLGWKFAATITPWVGLLTGGLFFTFLIFQEYTLGICALIGVTPVWMAMWLGLIQNCMTKGAKYSLFDPTKEMAYIPLDEESKIKGKAAIDVIGGRAGKSGGSFINMFFGAFSQGNLFLSFMGSVMIGICFWWIWAVQKLSNEYHNKIASDKDQE